MKSTKTLALIPARAGSKGIKNKNLALLAGKPLLFYTLQAAKESRCIDKIVLSSDGEEILEYGRTQGVEVLRRPQEFASDEASSASVIAHALESYACENLILLQPTSPLRDANDIDCAFKIYEEKSCTSLLSVVACDNKILKAFVLENDTLRGICNDTYPFTPRQKLPQTFLSNGAIYILNAEIFRKTGNFLTQKTGYYCMDSQKSLDIDNIEDLLQAQEWLLRNKPLT